MSLRDLVLANRSCRRFDRAVPVPEATLRELVDLARQTASAGNLQPLRYILVTDPETSALVFPNLVFAAWLKGWTPAEDERPTAYVVMVADTAVSGKSAHDQGIAAQTILLGAVEAGYAGCILASINRPALARLFGLPEGLEPALVLALGRPAEKRVIDELAPGGDTRYYRDAEGVHHVPKRPLSGIILDAAASPAPAEAGSPAAGS